jgi:hypothetical protein
MGVTVDSFFTTVAMDKGLYKKRHNNKHNALQQIRNPTGISSIFQKGSILKHSWARKSGKIFRCTGNIALVSYVPKTEKCDPAAHNCRITESHGNDQLAQNRIINQMMFCIMTE